MPITYRTTKEFTPELLQRLFQSVRWESGNYPDKLARAMANSTAVVSAWDGDRLVGLVRALSDGETVAFLHYLLVDPAYQGQHIGGTASLPAFTLGTGWVKCGDYYYYTKPVAPNQTPETNLTDSMTLVGSYMDTDGGKQAVDVMAEAIQSVPEDAVKAAWGAGFSIAADGSLIVPGN